MIQFSEYILFTCSIGDNVKLLLDRPDGVYCFRLQKDRVFYASERIIKLAATIGRDQLMSFGTCIGKFTKTQKFRLHITALEFLAPYAKVSLEGSNYLLVLIMNAFPH